MKGYVEVIKIYSDGSREVITEGSNLIVDGARQTLVDALTVSPSLINIPSASAILDASNYTVQAVSFGTSYESYASSYGRKQGLYPVDLSGYALSCHALPPANSYEKQGEFKSASANHILPKPPRPEDIDIEWQHPNQLAFSSNLGLDSSTAVQYGVWMGSPTNTDSENFFCLVFSSVDPLVSSTAGIISALPNPHFNSIDRIGMDTSGFLQLSTTYDTIRGGFMTSSDSDYPGLASIIYRTRIAQNDLTMTAFYGGIYTMGMWTIDLSATLATGETPPFGFTQLNNPRKYRLWGKKVFLNDLSRSKRYLHLDDLLVFWRITF